MEYGNVNRNQSYRWKSNSRRYAEKKHDTAGTCKCGGSTQRSISSYVTGRTQPPLDILNNICKELEISMDQILLLPVYHHPSRIVSEKDEIEYISQLDGLSALKKKEFVQIVRQMRKLIK